MTFSLLFWILYVVGLALYFHGVYNDRTRAIFEPAIIIWVLIGLLGYRVFG